MTASLTPSETEGFADSIDGSAGILTNPTDLNWSDEYNDHDGLPDLTKVREAAEELAAAKPHLGRVRGDIGQGQRGDDSDSVNVAGMLRASA